MSEELNPCPICRRTPFIAPSQGGVIASIHCGACNYAFGGVPLSHLIAMWNKLPRPCKHEWQHIDGEGYSSTSSVRCIKCGSSGDAETSD